MAVWFLTAANAVIIAAAATTPTSNDNRDLELYRIWYVTIERAAWFFVVEKRTKTKAQSESAKETEKEVREGDLIPRF